MRWVSVFSFVLLTALAVAHSQDQNAPTFKSADGFVPNIETAIKVAEAVLMPVYGEEQVLSERPYRTELKSDVWTVSGTLHCPKGELCAGGRAVVKISKTSGEILDMIHYK